MTVLRATAVALAALVLAACSSTQSTVLQGVRLAMFNSTPNLQNYPLNPKFVYLEVQTKGVSVLMPLAYEDKPTNGGPPIDTWVSADGEILRTQAGFLSSSAALSDFWTNVSYQFDRQGTPLSVQFDLPSKQLFNVVLQLQNLGQVAGNYTPLMQRAAKLPTVQFYAWQGQLANHDEQTKLVKAGLSLSSNKALSFVIGVDSKTGVPVYGLHCLQADRCVEYLLRSAQQNL